MYDIRIIKTSIGCKDGSQETLNPLQSSLTPKVGTNDGGSGGENMTWKTLSWEKGPRASETFFFFVDINTKVGFSIQGHLEKWGNFCFNLIM